MRRTRFDQNQCPIARTADLLGDWWTPLVLRELLLGRSRFNELQQALDINRSVLTQRLARLVDEGIVERRRYQEHPPRDDFELTDKGRALWDVLSVMWQYGERWLNDNPVPIEMPVPTEMPVGVEMPVRVEMYNKRTGERIEPVVIDRVTGEPLDVANTRRRLIVAPTATELPHLRPTEPKGPRADLC